MIMIRIKNQSDTIWDFLNPYSTVSQNASQKVYLLKHSAYRKQCDKGSGIFFNITYRLHLCYRYHYRAWIGFHYNSYYFTMLNHIDNVSRVGNLPIVNLWMRAVLYLTSGTSKPLVKPQCISLCTWKKHPINLDAIL